MDNVENNDENVLNENKDDKIYESLAPRDDLQDDSTIRLLRNALKDKGVKNIALTGRYGAGKTSTVLSALKNQNEYKPLYISLGILGIKNYKYSEEGDKIDIISQQIEKSIIQQIIYKEKTTKFPASKIKRIPSANYWLTFIILFGIIFTQLPIAKDAWRECCDFIQICSDSIWHWFCNIEFFNALEWCLKLIEPSYVLIKIIVLILLILYSSKYLQNWFRKFEIKNLKFLFLGNNEIEIGTSEESLINKYMDELVYFFEVTDYNVVVIEDLDRYLENEFMKHRILIIFQKLKELNQILNSTNYCLKNNKKITFLYVIKDDLFEDDKERTKFFDFIVPKIPELTNYNSYTKLRKSFSKEITDAFLQDISVHINDYRVIKNLKNEYGIYIDEIEIEGKDKEKILAMVVLKNLKPKIYEELLKDEGKLYSFLNNKEKLYKNSVEGLKDKIKIEKNKIEDLKKEKIESLKELKLIALGNTCDYYEYNSLKGIGLSVKDFLSDNFELENIEKNIFSIKNPRNISYYIYEEKLFEIFGSKNEFIERAKRIENGINEGINEANNKIIEYDNDIQNIESLTFSELIRKYEIKNDGTISKFEYMMIKNGYIDENYKDYCFKFEESESRVKTDYTYIFNVRNDKRTRWDCEIKNPENVIEELDLKYFKRKCIWNYDILNYLLINSNKYQMKLDNFMESFGKIDEDKYDFIRKYLKNDKSDKERIIQILYKYNILEKILRFGRNDNLDDIIKIILENNSILSNEKIMNITKEYLLKSTKCFDLFVINERTKKSLKDILKIKFVELERNIDDTQFEFIYENNLYILNEKNLKYIFNRFGYTSGDYESRCLSIIFEDENFDNLCYYIENNKDNFIKNCFINSNGINNYENHVIECINEWDIDNSSKEILIEKFPGRLKDISIIKDKGLYEYFIKYNKCECSWKNLYNIYIENKKFTEEYVNFVSENISILDSLTSDRVSELGENNFILKIINCEMFSEKVFQDLIDKLDVKFTFEDIKELKNDRIKILVDSQKLEFSIELYNFLSNIDYWITLKYIYNNFENFMSEIGNLSVDNDIIENILLNEDIAYKDKNIILKRVSPYNISEYALEYIIENYRKRGFFDFTNELKERIITSNISIDKKIEFIWKEEKLGLLDDLKLNEYIDLLPEQYCFIGNYEKRQKCFSLPYDENLMKLLKIKEKKLNITVKPYKNTILIYNLKTKKTTD